ncbi:hypothetical protein F5876DRAFT_80465 [Lentinula aff. lateritia]|uniref:Uncharacterized protein n=1 Tax=Lentinula aff. lateritia TaxID=2804960 RepID=A0ACC1TPI2_9AGAR|nr:hypothetical protein F5876DRAFT_80465 [Lentinula aff. lateritia]
MLFAVSGNQIILNEADYINMFVDVNPAGTATTNGLDIHPRNTYQFTLVGNGVGFLAPSDNTESSRGRIFRLIRTNPNGDGYSEIPVYCQEYSETKDSESEASIESGLSTIPTLIPGPTMQDYYHHQESHDASIPTQVFDLESFLASFSAVQPTMNSQPEFDLNSLIQAGFDTGFSAFDSFVAPVSAPGAELDMVDTPAWNVGDLGNMENMDIDTALQQHDWMTANDLDVFNSLEFNSNSFASESAFPTLPTAFQASTAGAMAEWATTGFVHEEDFPTF